MALPPCCSSLSSKLQQHQHLHLQPVVVVVSMDFLFNMADVAERDAFLHLMMQTFGFSYICLWSHSHQPASSCLQSLGGTFQEAGESSQQAASSSSGPRARQLFEAYQGSGPINVDFERVPGLAFRNKDPYMELKLPELRTLAYRRIQLEFYQEARIQTVVFMGCPVGEIELGMSSEPPIDLKMRLESLFGLVELPLINPIDPTNQQPPSSSSSSLHSLSIDMDSPEYGSLLFNIPPTSFFPESPISETLLQEALRSASTTLTPQPPRAVPEPPISSPHEQAIRTLSQIRSLPFPIETVEAEMTKAMLAVIRSPSISSTAPQNIPHVTTTPVLEHNRTTAFRGYRDMLGPGGSSSTRKHSMFKRAVLYLRNLDILRRREQSAAPIQEGNPRPITAQSWQHTIQERRRRKKINDSLTLLKSLVPPGSKKDKASVLSSTTDYLRKLQSQVTELVKRNQMLELQLKSLQKREPSNEQKQMMGAGDQQRVNVQITPVSASSSGARLLDLRITVRRECTMLDLVIRTLEFLRQQRDLSLLSVESNLGMSVQNIPVHEIMLRLRIEGDEFDEATFQEAVRRAVDE